MGAIQICIGAAASAMVSILQNYFSPMAGVMAFCTLLVLSVFTLGRKIIVQEASAEVVEEEDVEMVSTL